MAGFRDKYVSISRKYIATEPNTKSFQLLNKKLLGPTLPFLDFKNSDIFTQIQQKRPYQTPLVADFRDTYASISRKYIATEPKTKSFQLLNENIFRSHSPVSRFQKNSDIFTQIQQKRPYQTRVVARFRGTYPPTSRK